MKHIIAFITTLGLSFFLFSGTAAAVEISCPLDQATTQVTTPLPGPWWQTPQLGSLEGTEVAAIGGELTLVCKYWAYGTTVSVMRKAPPARQNCSPTSTGFTCTSGRRTASTYSTGSIAIRQTWQADLDNGTEGVGTGNDIWFEAVTATNRYVTAINGARIGIYSGGGGISRHDCVTTPKSANRIAISAIPVGTYVCVRTDQGRHAAFRVNAVVGPSPGILQIGYTTWE